jgi:tetratricopeptide (TPR) repeat protein
MKHAFRLSFLAAFAIASLTAQRTGSGGPGGGTTGSSGTNAPSGNGTSTSSTNSTPDLGSPESAPIFISGKVVVDDGSPAPQNISIQRICQNNPRTVAYTDGKGHFSFQWGNTSATVIPDASEGGFSGPLSIGGRGQGQQGAAMARRAGDPLAGCEIRASATGFRSDSIDLTEHRALDNFDVGTIVLHRLANVEGTSVSATALNAPKDAAKAYEKGMESLHKNKPDDAAKDFQKAVGIYPKYANAWLELGRIQMQQKMTDPARDSFKKAIAADAKLVDAWAQLGLMAAQTSNWPDAVQYLDGALKLDPVEYPQLWLPDAIAGYNMKNFDVAERSAREAIKADPQHRFPKADELLGNALLQKRQYAEAADALRAYMKFAPDAPDIDLVKAQVAQLDALPKPAK